MTRQDQPDDAPHYDAEDVRGAEIVLRTRRQRMIFAAGLAAAVLLVILVAFAA